MRQLVPRSRAMHAVRFTSLDTLAPLASQWDGLARGIPFRLWGWAAAWWNHYGPALRGRASPFVLAAFDRDDRLVGLAPWYVETTLSRGRVVRFLGSGEVCSEHLSLLCAEDREAEVAEIFADWLTEAAAGDVVPGMPCDRWDLLELTAVDASERAMALLGAALEARGNVVHRRPGHPCWPVRLPGRWADYLAASSKAHRRRMRRCEQRFREGRAVMRTVERPEQLPRIAALLVDLHRRRRQRMGKPSCFESPRFFDFHRDAMGSLLAQRRLVLVWVEFDGRPAAVDYALLGNDALYSYQAGVNPDLLGESPGHLGNYALTRMAIERGLPTLDFLRGNEPYKASWGAEPRAMLEIRAAPDRPAARLRHNLWLAGAGMKRWLRRLRGEEGRLA